jgi:hypothetical protein
VAGGFVETLDRLHAARKTKRKKTVFSGFLRKVQLKRAAEPRNNRGEHVSPDVENF